MKNEKDNIEKLITEKNVQFRDFKLTGIETRAEEESGTFILTGTPAVFESETVIWHYDGVDYKEVIDRGAFDGADMSDVIFNYNHCGRVYARTRNKSLKLNVTEKALEMEAQLFPDDQGHKELYRDISSGLIDKMSFAFTVREDSYDRETHTRRILKIDRVFDVSAVDIPAYDATSISARSFFDEEIRKEIEEIEKRQKALSVARAKYFYF